MNKVNQNINVYNMKDANVVSATVSAWDKPLGSQMRGIDHDAMMGVTMDNCKGMEPGQVPQQGANPNAADKVLLIFIVL